MKGSKAAAAGGVAAVERALSILDAFRAAQGELSLATLAERTGLYKSTILRLIVSLEAGGYIRRIESGNYQLGPKVAELSVRLESSSVRGGRFRVEQIRPEGKRVVALDGDELAFRQAEAVQRFPIHRRLAERRVATEQDL